MAGKDKKEIVVAGTGTIYAAPTGTTMPDDIEDALNVAFVDLGYTTPDGAKFTYGRTTEDVNVWQRFNPARKIVTSASAIAAFVLRQYGKDQVKLAFGGGDFSTTANGEMYEPPEPGDLDERAIIISIVDGDKKAMICIKDAIVSENVETNFARTSASDLPITLAALADDDVAEKPWYILGNDAFWNAS